MASSTSNPANNLSEGIHQIKCEIEHNNKKYETCAIKQKHCDYFLEYTNFADGLIEYKCLSCNKRYLRKLDEKLNERFFKIYKFLTMITISLHEKEDF